MNRLRQTLIVLLAALYLGGVPACGKDDVKQAGEKAKREGKQAAGKAKKKAEEAKNKAEKAKKDVDGQ
jgi:hypothetical protein